MSTASAPFPCDPLTTLPRDPAGSALSPQGAGSNKETFSSFSFLIQVWPHCTSAKMMWLKHRPLDYSLPRTPEIWYDMVVLHGVWLFATPMDWSPPGSSVHGILQARTLEWVAMPSFRAPFQPRNQTHVSCISCIGGQIPYHYATWEALLPAVNTQKLGENKPLIIFDCQIWG